MGGCCHNNYPCDKCLLDTLRANGIDVSEVDRFKGLPQKTSVSPWEYSELCKAIKQYWTDTMV